MSTLSDGLKELGLYKSIKVIIAPTHNVADYWIKHLKLDKNCKVYTHIRQLRNVELKRNEVLVLFGAKFSYPENNLRTHMQMSTYFELVEDVERAYV